MLSLQLPDNAEGVITEAGRFQGAGWDMWYFADFALYNEQAIYLEGHVFRLW